MATNILKLISNVKNLKSYNLDELYNISQSSTSKNRINSVGEALEIFIKDSFCNSYNENNMKKQSYHEHFSYLGNQNNPPDIIIKNGDAVEVKKIDGVRNSDIALNSSYPKSKLYSDSPLITSSCRDCEDGWMEKDIIYAVGNIENNSLRILTLIYGDCYAANKEIYEKVITSISRGFEDLDLDFSKTKELGRVNRIDPLGITNLRIRGMWTIQNPLKLYENMLVLQQKQFQLFVIMKKEKFNSFSKEDINNIICEKEINIEDTTIQDPNNPAKLMEVKIIQYQK